MKKEKLGFHIVLLGQIAAGKDTQAGLLIKKFALKPVESGKYSRQLIKEKGPDGDWARRTIGLGKPAPTPLIKKLLIRALDDKPKNMDLLFQGNPRLKPEAQFLKKKMQERKQNFLVIYITLSDKEIYKRSLQRGVSTIKELYRIFDDKKLITIRMKWHKEQVSKTIAYFDSLGKLKKVNGNQTIEKVNRDIEKAISNFENKLKK
jgi:adenylate kinase